MTVCEELGRWAAGLSLAAVPERVLERARLQTDAVLAAGRAGERAAASFAAGAPRGPPGEIYMGAAASIAHDWDDYLFMGHTGHSSVWTSRAFASDDAERALLAQIAGNEVAGRLGAALFLGPHNGQFWSSIHCGGAAAAAGVALGLDPGRLAHAIAISLYQPPYGLWPGFMGPETKLLTAAEPAAQGSRAALLAAEGVHGPLDVIESPRGLLTHLAFVRRPAMLGALGGVWLTDTLAFKPLPGCAYLQAAVEAALRSELAPGDIAGIEVEAGVLTVAMEELAPASLGGPASVNFSAARSVAIALIAGALTHEQLDPAWLAEHAAEIEELAGRVRVRHDWELSLDTLRGTVDAGVSASDVGAGGWLRVLRRMRELRMPEVIDAGELRRLVGRGDLRAELWRLVRKPGGGLESLDTGAMRMSFPCRLRFRLRSGRRFEVEGAQPGSSGRPLEEQRRVVEEKCRLVGLERVVASS
ncbi:MAG TPA: MmgE/PrpD family protein [Thermoleophilaceae bacterium]